MTPLQSAPDAHWTTPRVSSLDARVGWVFFVPLVAATLLAKLGTPLGRGSIPMSWPMIFAAAFIGLYFGRLRFDISRLAAYSAAMGLICLIQAAQGMPFSVPSFVLMAVTYLMLILRAGEGQFTQDQATRWFLKLATFIAICGIAQFCLQFVLPTPFIFPIENLLPESLIVNDFNMEARLNYLSDIFRSNGVFMLEPSFFSQLLAVAMIVELCNQSRNSRLMIYLIALVMTYSGTGLVVLAVCLPLLVIQRQRWDLMAAAGLVALVMIVFAPFVNLDLFVERFNEFDNPKSSGFERFVGAFYLFDQFLWTDVWRGLFGIGAGTYWPYSQAATLPAHEMAHSKIIFEFGVIGATIHFTFLSYCIFKSQAPFLIRLAIFVTFFMNGLYTVLSHAMALTLLMWPGEPDPRARRPAGGTADPASPADPADFADVADSPRFPHRPDSPDPLEPSYSSDSFHAVDRAGPHRSGAAGGRVAGV